MSEIRFKCEHCNIELGAPPGTGGKLTDCPKCGKKVRIPNESSQGIDDTSTEMVGLLVGIDFLPSSSEFETLLKNGDLVPGLTYGTIELTKQEAENEKYLTNMFQGAALKQGWPQGVYTKLTITKAQINTKPVVIVYPSIASPTVDEAANKASPNITSKSTKDPNSKKWWQFWK